MADVFWRLSRAVQSTVLLLALWFCCFCRWKCPAQCAIGLWPDAAHEQKVQISSRPVAAFSPPWGSAVDFSRADEAPLPQFRLPESKAD